MRAPMLSAFLRFVVEAALAGNGDRIKAYTIAVDALGRRSGFDAESDAIVRVNAIRIRRAFERYYATDGVNAAVVIDLPRGRYVPTFQRRGASPIEQGRNAGERAPLIGESVSNEMPGCG